MVTGICRFNMLPENQFSIRKKLVFPLFSEYRAHESEFLPYKVKLIVTASAT